MDWVKFLLEESVSSLEIFFSGPSPAYEEVYSILCLYKLEV